MYLYFVTLTLHLYSKHIIIIKHKLHNCISTHSYYHMYVTSFKKKKLFTGKHLMQKKRILY